MATKTPELSGSYTVEKAEHDLGELRGKIAVLQEAITQADTDLVPNTPVTGNIQFSSAGHQKYASSDGSGYNTGRQTMYVVLGSPFTVTGITSTTVTGWAQPLSAGQYRMNCHLDITNGANTTNIPHAQVNNSNGIAGMRVKAYWNVGNAAYAASKNDPGATINANTWGWDATAMGSNGGSYEWNFTGIFSLTAAATFSFQIASSAGGLSWTINTLSFFEVLPIT